MEEIKKKLQFGIVGIGEHALKVIAAFENSELSSLLSLGTSATQKALFLKNKFPNLEIFSSYEELLSNNKIEAIYISTANNLHYTLAKKTLEAKKHVLCEKPLCLKYQEAVELSKLAEKNSKIIVEGLMYRFHPQHQEVKNLLKTGVIGEPKLLNAYYHYQLDDTKNIRLQKECAGGALTDAGCYLIDLCLFLFNDAPLKISATANYHQQLQVDLTTQVQLIFSNNFQANLSASMEMPRNNSYAIYGTRGSIKVRNAFHIEPKQITYIELQNSKGKISTIKIPPFNQLAAQLDAFSLYADNPCRPHLFNDYALNAKIMEEIIRQLSRYHTQESEVRNNYKNAK